MGGERERERAELDILRNLLQVPALLAHQPEQHIELLVKWCRGLPEALERIRKVWHGEVTP